MADIISDLGINILEEEIDDVIFQTNEFLCDVTISGSCLHKYPGRLGRLGWNLSID